MNSGRDRFEEIRRRLPGGCSTAAKSPLRHAPPQTPWFAISGSGGTFKDDQGRRWLDFDMALAACILGYDPGRIRRAVVRQLSRGVTFSVPSWLEGELAERLADRFPAMEAVRFCKDGSDATTAAVRLARRVTGRSRVVTGAYHGWLDWSAVGYYGADGVDAGALGVPGAVAAESTWLQRESWEELSNRLASLREVAAVVVCPENWPLRDLARLADRCAADGALLVFDEVKSGLRYGPRGVHGALGRTPDLVCLGKSLANGHPLAALGGRSDLMADVEEIRFSTTGGSEAISLAAALAVDEEIRCFPRWPPWQTAGEALMGRMEQVIASGSKPLHLSGYAGNFRIQTPTTVARLDPFRTHFVHCLAARGIFSSGFVLPCTAHREEDFRRLEEAMEEAIRSWKGAPRNKPEQAKGDLAGAVAPPPTP